jgi:hypothetical protein
MMEKDTDVREDFFEPPLLDIPSVAPSGVSLLLAVRGRHGTGCHLVGKHKREKAGQADAESAGTIITGGDKLT